MQYVIRPDLDFRGFAGTIVRGHPAARRRDHGAAVGQATAAVESIVTYDGELEWPFAAQAVTVTLADEIDVSRGDMLGHAGHPPAVSSQIEAMVVWMAEQPLLPGRGYIMRVGIGLGDGDVAPLKYKLDLDTQAHIAATKLELNEIGECHLALDRRIAFDPYTVSRDTGGFILIDRITFETVAAGMLRYALRRSANVQLAGGRDRQAPARLDQETAPGGRVADRAFGRRQVDHRQPRRSAAALARHTHLHARRRQRPPRAVSRTSGSRPPTASRTCAASARCRD